MLPVSALLASFNFRAGQELTQRFGPVGAVIIVGSVGLVLWMLAQTAKGFVPKRPRKPEPAPQPRNEEGPPGFNG
jgi:hypothetical protein